MHKAAKDRAAKVSAQGGNVVNSIDGMSPSKAVQPDSVPVTTSAEAKPTILSTQPNSPVVTPTQPTQGEPSVFKLGSTIPEEKQGGVDGPSPATTGRGANTSNTSNTSRN